MSDSTKDIMFAGDPVAFDGVEGRRDSKIGKGRFDLIPEDVFEPLFERVTASIESGEPIDVKPMDIMLLISDNLFLEAIIRMIMYSYCPPDVIDNNMAPVAYLERCMWVMLQDLAIHFQKGAEHYGERNCQKGIPLWSFKDSAMRHAAQSFAGEDDEPHKISVIWNCWLAAWTEMQSAS